MSITVSKLWVDWTIWNFIYQNTICAFHGGGPGHWRIPFTTQFLPTKTPLVDLLRTCWKPPGSHIITMEDPLYDTIFTYQNSLGGPPKHILEASGISHKCTGGSLALHPLGSPVSDPCIQLPLQATHSYSVR